MAKVKASSSTSNSHKRRSSFSTESEEQQMVALAMNLVKQRLLDGTASAQETTHFLKLGGAKHQYELEKLREENKLLRAKSEAIETGKESKEMYEAALKAMRNYAGYGEPEEYEDDDEYY